MKRFAPLLAALLISCGSNSDSGTSTKKVTLISPSGDAVNVQAEIADSPEMHQRGLMHRTDLTENEGMLFIFQKEEERSFWMKNTLISLDAIFFDAEKNFVSSQTMEPCKEDPCLMYDSKKPAKYVLEVPAGLVQKYRIGRGWEIGW